MLQLHFCAVAIAFIQVMLFDQQLVAFGQRMVLGRKYKKLCAEIPLFDHRCHLATVQDETDLHEVLSSRQAMVFDIDTCGLLRKRLAAGGKMSAALIRFEARQAVDLALD